MHVIIVALLVLCSAQNTEPSGDQQYNPLTQDMFDAGTVIISTSGFYRLEGDIEFNAKAPADASQAYGSYTLAPSDFTSGGGRYPDQVYQIGFWAAISVQANNVTIDLNGHTIQQHRAHNLMNRYFNVIELGSQPFLQGQGFHDFGGNRTSASSITIRNGRIGRTATNGIHGIDNNRILIENIEFYDFEQSAVSMHGVNTLMILDCSARGNHDVRVNSVWDTALNIRPYIDYLASLFPNYALNVNGQSIAVTSIQSELRSIVNWVYERVITKNDDLTMTDAVSGDAVGRNAVRLFRNDHKRPDGECWAFSIGGRNFDGTGFPFENDPLVNPISTFINITNVNIVDVECAPAEAIAISSGVSRGFASGPVLDPRARVFSFMTLDWDYDNYDERHETVNSSWLAVTVSDQHNLGTAVYVGTTVTNAQAIVGKAVLDGMFGSSSNSTLQTARSSFNRAILGWVEATDASTNRTLDNYIVTTAGDRHFMCNTGDYYRVQTGVGGIRMTTTNTASIQNVYLAGLRNFGFMGSGICPYTQTTRSNQQTVIPGYSGADTRGITIAACNDIYLTDNFAEEFQSYWGTIWVFEVLTKSRFVYVDGHEVLNMYAGEWVREDNLDDLRQYENNPGRFPVAIAFHVDGLASNVTLYEYCVNGMNAPNNGEFKTSLGNTTIDMGEWDGCHAGRAPWWVWLLLGIVALIFILAIVAVIMACLDVKKEEKNYKVESTS